MGQSRHFILSGAVFLLIGIALGTHMSASGNHDLRPVHAHINLLGFTLMSIFGLVYQVFPAMGASKLCRIHFWLHLVGSIILLTMLALLLTGKITEAAMVPLAPISELMILIGIVLFLWNGWKNLR